MASILSSEDATDEDLLTDRDFVSVSQAKPSIDGEAITAPPKLLHRFNHNKSILVLAVSDSCVFAGTQGGEILVFSLTTFERIRVVNAHKGSVLGLHLSKDRRYLFSCAGDRIVNVWCPGTFKHIYSIYSTYDIGDVFCVAFSCTLETVYLGAQNTSIQWYDLKEKDSRPLPKPQSHPSFREDKFFDSTGPGGVRTPRPQSDGARHDAKGGQILEIDKQHIQEFAHFGYVNCILCVAGSTPGQEILISGGGDGIIKLWRLDAEGGGAIHELDRLDDGREEGESVLCLAKDGPFLYSGRLDGEINVWDLETKQLVRSVNTKCGDVLTLSVGHGLILTAGVTGFVQRFNQHYEGTNDWRAHKSLTLSSCLTCLDARLVYVTGGNDKTIALWELGNESDQLDGATRTSNEQLLDTLEQFVSLRTVSSEPKYAGECRRGATYLKSVFNHFGAKTEMLKTEQHCPIVFARFRGIPRTAGKRKKILFYGHYDVVPAANKQGTWDGDPFVMQRKDGYVYGRGVTDNKGPILAAIYAVADIVREQRLESDIIFLIEGEQECGSRGFEKAIKQNKEIIGDVDWILLANSYWINDEVPCLNYGLRGVIQATVQIESGKPDLHSGVDGSRLLDEPLKDLVILLARLNGARGKVLMPAFYDPVRPVTEEERQLYADIANVLIDRDSALGTQEDVIAALMGRWRYPSLTVHGFKTSGPDNPTIIPHKATAALSLRLVPDQDAANVAKDLVHYLQGEFRQLNSHNRLTVTIDRQAQPWVGDFSNAIFQALETAIVDAWELVGKQRQYSLKDASHAPMKENLKTQASPVSTSTWVEPRESKGNKAHGSLRSARGQLTRRRPLYIREGGSIPSIRFLEKEFGAPAAQFPCGQASDGAHLDNERMRILNLYKSRDIFKHVFAELPRK